MLEERVWWWFVASIWLTFSTWSCIRSLVLILEVNCCIRCCIYRWSVNLKLRNGRCSCCWWCCRGCIAWLNLFELKLSDWFDFFFILLRGFRIRSTETLTHKWVLFLKEIRTFIFRSITKRWRTLLNLRFNFFTLTLFFLLFFTFLNKLNLLGFFWIILPIFLFIDRF